MLEFLKKKNIIHLYNDDTVIYLLNYLTFICLMYVLLLNTRLYTDASVIS